ncbi:CUB domain-containing protein 2-like, partial [Gigantopelta aegis]|uniref:CUB domain-containing protein 2-like n=1 Tax=Gigantopelta aegis TaxID=1735272 RepID=UPI001B887D6F
NSTSASNVLGEWCGNEQPEYSSTRGAMVIVFKADGTEVFRGFKLSYKQTRGCGGTLTANSYVSYLTSPGYPTGYHNNLLCIWTIEAANPNYKVQINVVDSQLEKESTCNYDRVTAYDGNSTSASNVLGEWCGNEQPEYSSTRGAMVIVFKADGTEVFRGFKLSYKQTRERYSCSDQELTAHYYVKTLTSPNYPLNYANNMDCSWKISTLPGRFVQIKFLNVKIESTSGCLADYVEIYN